ncbi:MAG: Trk system potassium transporter TrkA [Planctomycetia bacterium]|nr:Trk system potassium transporter TrkA [Planctomycetia bacterium]
MRIVILGAGTVGSSIARMLCAHRHEVVLVDDDPAVVGPLADTLDAMVLEGNASHAAVLFQANAMNADLCLAMTGSDEANLVGASIAKAMGSRRVIARVHSTLAQNLAAFDYRSHFRIDRILSLGQLTAMRLSHEIDMFSEALSLEAYFDGDIELMVMTLSAGAKCLGRPIRDLAFPSNVRIGCIHRDKTYIIPGADDTLQAGDKVTLIGAHDNLLKVRKNLGGDPPETKTVVIAGAGETGLHLAQLIHKRHRVRILETDRERCLWLAELMKRDVEVVNIDVQCRAALEEERVGNADVFVACTGSDETNILVCVEAKELGTKKVFSIINRPDYGNVTKKLGIDVSVSPREEVSQKVMNFLNLGAVISKKSDIFGMGVCLLELEVQAGSLVTRGTLMEAKLPSQCVVLGAIHQGTVVVPGADYRFEAGDTAMLITTDPVVERVLRKFESGV